MSALRSHNENCLVVLGIIGVLAGCGKTPAEPRDAGPSSQATSSTSTVSMPKTSPSQNLPVAAEVEAPPDRVSSGCGSFRFALTPGRIVRNANGPGTMDAVLAIYVRESSAITQRISLKIDTDYQGLPVLDPEVICGDFDFDGAEDFAVKFERRQNSRGPDGDTRRARMKESAAFLRSRLEGHVHLGTSSSWIITVLFGADKISLPLFNFLQMNGVEGSIFMLPAVNRNEGRIRLFVTSEHTHEQLERAANIIIAAASRFRFGVNDVARP